jgi:hypothetical protein
MIQLYYSILLVVGNDVMPSIMSEFQLFSLVLIIGAFLEAYIIGGITAEMAKHKNKKIIFDKNIEYIKFSNELHNFPVVFQHQIILYMNKCEESLAVQNDLDEVQMLINPALTYEVLN